MTQNNFSDGYKKAMVNAENNIKELGFKELKIEDLFLEIVKNSSGLIKELFDVYGIDEKLTIEIIERGLAVNGEINRKGVYSGMNKNLKNVILGSVKIAASFSKSKASIEDFLLSILQNDTWFPNFLSYIGINPTDLEIHIIEISKAGSIDGISQKNNESDNDSIGELIGAITENLFGEGGKGTSEDNKKKKNNSNTPALDFFSNDLTQMANEGKIDKVIGRENEIERLIAILNRKTKNNPVLVGDPGVGKTAIVEGLALKIKEGKVPFSMKDKRILALDISAMIAGTKYRGEFETRIKQVIDEASIVENEVILFIDELHTIIGAGGGEGSLDISNILKPAMGRGQIRVIGATTLNEYQKYIEKDSALERRFQKILTKEPSEETTIDIIKGLKEVFEEYHNLNINDSAILEAVYLSTRYITDRYLPDKAIDLIDEACSIKSMKYNFNEDKIITIKEKIAKLEKEIESSVISQQYKKASTLKEKLEKLEKEVSDMKKKFSIPKEKRFNVDSIDVQRVLHISTGIPIANLNKNELTKLKKLNKDINSEIIGQKEGIDSIIKSIMRNKAGIGEANKPLGSFLFLGPTGVGKTELVKVLAKKYYDDKDALIKIDMSEYSDKTSVNKLIGSNAGYIGYEEGGLLTEKVRKKPYSIILFDEIEKGDFEVYNLLLQILEEGMLTDNKGRIINFKNTIIVMTSNIGQEEFSSKAAQIGFDVTENEEEKIMKDYSKAKENIISNLPNYFSPEFINRIDKIIVFNPLDKNQIKKIVKLRLEQFKERLNEKGFSLEYNNKVVNYISKSVYNPEFGAREIRRYITENLEDIIAEKIINSDKKTSFEVDIIKNELVIK
ncbi:ATP-dependent Clp protease ATP-binding subunit ClpC [Candidatus Gracilibacteria bacterium]|nr:MAG: ATP-dependent Clp protease ATP-binding subunit ClpC [Candidatus Gracilibacteria bacterium]